MRTMGTVQLHCLLRCTPNPFEHHDSVMAARSCGVPKERFAKTRSLHPLDAAQGFGISQQALLAANVNIF